MKVGVLVLTFRLRQAKSLKDKRSLVGRVRERVRSRYNVSVAELDAQDDLRRLVMGFSIVGSNKREMQSILDKLSNYVDSLYLAEIVGKDVWIETIGNSDDPLTRQHL